MFSMWKMGREPPIGAIMEVHLSYEEEAPFGYKNFPLTPNSHSQN